MKSVEYQETSREAFIKFKPVSGDLDKKILEAISSNSDGMICQDIEKMIDRTHQAVSGNLRHLVERGFVKNSGKFGKTTSNRKAIIWQIV